MKYVKTHRRRDICFLFISIPFAVLSIAAMTLPAFYEDIVDMLIKQNLQLETGTQQWDWFMELPMPINFNIYIFNLTNPDEVKTGAKPNFKEEGPYVFTQTRKKTEESIEFIGDSVSYREIQNYVFDETQSYPQSSSDNFISVNVVFMIITQILENVPFQIDNLEETIENVYGNSDIIDTYNIGEIVFDGLHLCDPAKTTVTGKLVCLMLSFLHLRFVSHLPDGSMKLSLFEYKNGKDAGVFNVNRGTEDMEKFMMINSWEGKTRTNYWKGENNECDNIAGTREGTLFTPKVHGQNFRLFSMDICRTVELTMETTESEFEGVDTYKYVLEGSALISDDPEGCYCLKKTKGLDGEPYCFMDGFMDLHSCFGIPALLSFPHFLDADPKYLDYVEGLNPDKEKHGTSLLLEPVSGAPLTGSRKVQFNFVTRPIKKSGLDEPIESTALLRRLVFPLAWAEETTSVEGELLDLIQTLTYWYKFFDIFKWLLSWILGAVFAAPSFWVMFEVYTTKRQESVTKAIVMDI